ncbi:MAG: ASCH domain-containing protein [Calditrichaeota bacterium]|nr:ASCH domain-containing protein [Calditrichota bacterium]
MSDLFTQKENIIIKKIDFTDIEYQSNHLNNFSDLILRNEIKYPNIDIWLNNKVIPGIRDSQRAAYVGYINNNPIISAVVKKDQNAKICHLKIGDDLQDYGIGDIFLSLMIFDVIKEAKNVHFTIPEGLWGEKNQFFKSFGFNNISKAETQYRHGEDELMCSSPINEIYSRILSQKLPKLFYHYSLGGFSNDINLILSIHPHYIDKILSGDKTVELRRSFSTKWIGSKAVLYSTSPSREIKGYVTINNIEKDTPEKIWDKYKHRIGTDRNNFEKYCKNKEKIYAIEMDEIKKYVSGIPITQIEGILKKKLTIPQSHMSTTISDDWYKGVSIATLLHSMQSQAGLKYTSLLNQLNSVLSKKDIINID